MKIFNRDADGWIGREIDLSGRLDLESWWLFKFIVSLTIPILLKKSILEESKELLMIGNTDEDTFGPWLSFCLVNIFHIWWPFWVTKINTFLEPVTLKL
jgi:hypothetical protein